MSGWQALATLVFVELGGTAWLLDIGGRHVRRLVARLRRPSWYDQVAERGQAQRQAIADAFITGMERKR